MNDDDYFGMNPFFIAMAIPLVLAFAILAIIS